MQYAIEIQTTESPEIDTVGLAATVIYVLNANLKQIPGIESVTISEIVSN